MHKKAYLFVALIFISGAACSEQSATTTESYKAEAKALCDAFNPETWKVDTKSMNPSQMAEMLSNKITSAIHSDEMKKIYKSLSHDRSSSAYANYAKNVSALVGEPYSCDAMKDYFSVNFN